MILDFFFSNQTAIERVYLLYMGK